MRAAGRLVAQVRESLRRMVRPGVTTLELDAAAEKMIRDAGALPTFKGYHGFPFSICASVNEQVVHGFPSTYVLQEGDIFSLDCGVTLDGQPSAHVEHTVAITEDGPEVLTLLAEGVPEAGAVSA